MVPDDVRVSGRSAWEYVIEGNWLDAEVMGERESDEPNGSLIQAPDGGEGIAMSRSTSASVCV